MVFEATAIWSACCTVKLIIRTEKPLHGLPAPKYSRKTITLAHSSPTAGRGGARVTLAKCQKFVYWPGMKWYGDEFVRKCVTCSRFKRVGNFPPVPLRHYLDVSSPFDRIHLDLIGPMRTSENSYVMMITDVFTRYFITVPLRSKEARDVARAIYFHVICIHGAPQTVIADQGTEFVNHVR